MGNSTQLRYYDVALSFAGEDRSVARSVAEELMKRGIRVFYDEHERIAMWGKNLYDHLSEIYENRAIFCVIFISQHYASKLWTTHERKAAQARAFREHNEYILPVRLDNTSIPGIAATVGYVAWPPENAVSLSIMIIEKLKHSTEFLARDFTGENSDDEWAFLPTETQTSEISGPPLKIFLDKHLGPDGRITSFSYEYEAEHIRHLGFSSLEQVLRCISTYDDLEISLILHGHRQGQTTRLMDMLLAGMGLNYVNLHRWSRRAWFVAQCQAYLRQLDEAGVQIGNFNPKIEK